MKKNAVSIIACLYSDVSGLQRSFPAEMEGEEAGLPAGEASVAADPWGSRETPSFAANGEMPIQKGSAKVSKVMGCV